MVTARALLMIQNKITRARSSKGPTLSTNLIIEVLLVSKHALFYATMPLTMDMMAAIKKKEELHTLHTTF